MAEDASPDRGAMLSRLARLLEARIGGRSELAHSRGHDLELTDIVYTSSSPRREGGTDDRAGAAREETPAEDQEPGVNEHRQLHTPGGTMRSRRTAHVGSWTRPE